MQPEVIGSLVQANVVCSGIDSRLFDQVLKMSLVVGLDRLDQGDSGSPTGFRDKLWVWTVLAAWISYKQGIPQGLGLAQLMENGSSMLVQAMAFRDSGNLTS